MKSFKFLAIFAVISVLCISCKKEGVFSPKNKIDSIYFSSTRTAEDLVGNEWVTIDESSVPKSLEEVWNWEGDLLKSIDYYHHGDFDYTEYYEYDNKRLVSINWGGDVHYSLTYQNGKISTIYLYYTYDSSPAEACVFTHKNGKISQITYYDNGYITSEQALKMMRPFRFFLPNSSMESFTKTMCKIHSENQAKDYEPFIVQLEWQGNNVKKMTYLNGTHTDGFDYTYDNKLNPYYGLFNMEEFADKPFLSKNNIIGDGTYEYSYTYDGNRPTTQSCSYTSTYEDFRESINYTYYYEYK